MLYTQYGEPSTSAAVRTNESGFTVIEAIIAILLTSLIIGFAYSSYTFLSRMMAQWKTRMTIENTSHQIMRDWTASVRDAVEVELGDDAWRFVSPSGSPTTYRLTDQTLVRNRRSMHGDEIDVVKMSVERNSVDQTDQSAPSNPVDRLGTESPSPDTLPGMVRLRLTLATNTDTLSTGTMVHLRQPERWSSSPIERGVGARGRR